jgi:hypothetical protein
MESDVHFVLIVGYESGNVIVYRIMDLQGVVAFSRLLMAQATPARAFGLDAQWNPYSSNLLYCKTYTNYFPSISYLIYLGFHFLLCCRPWDPSNLFQVVFTFNLPDIFV